MFLMALGVILCLLAIFAVPSKITYGEDVVKVPFIKYGVMSIAALLTVWGAFGAVSYNDAGKCVHVRTLWGAESSKCDLGWYLSGWGNVTEWNHFITISFSTDPANNNASSAEEPFPVKMADNVSGVLTSTARFSIPQDVDQFLTMARTYRTPERLVSTSLRPSVVASMDATASMFGADQYYDGARNDFKNEFTLAVKQGIAKVRRTETRRSVYLAKKPKANDIPGDTSEEETSSTVVRIVKLKDDKGRDIRDQHEYVQYGIIAATAILETFDPEDSFEDRIDARKKAASERAVAREQRIQEEEQRLLAIARGEREIAEQKAATEKEQIKATTQAETERKLAVISAEKVRQEAQIAKETSQINFEKAQIDAQTKERLADADAYEKRVVLEADGALDKKLKAMVQIAYVNAEAIANVRLPSTTISSGGEGGAADVLGAVTNYLNILNTQTAKNLSVDTEVK